VVDNTSNIIATKNTNDSNRGLVWDASIHKYTATVDVYKGSGIYFGFAPFKLYDVSKQNRDSCGWYLSLYSGTLYSQKGDIGKAYGSKCQVGDTITCIYNASTNEISYEKNSVSLGVAYTNVKGEDIAPVVELYYVGDSVTLSIINK
jgi:SPRY domain